MSRYYTRWRQIDGIVESDLQLQRLRARMEQLGAGGYGSVSHQRAQRAYLTRRRLVEERARIRVQELEVDRERAAKAAYMRVYRARKRAIREAVDARRRSMTG